MLTNYKFFYYKKLIKTSCILKYLLDLPLKIKYPNTFSLSNINLTTSLLVINKG